METDRNDRYYSELGLAATILEATSDADFPQYGFGIVQAVALAGALGCTKVRALELGVAGGNGLLALERLSLAHSIPSGVQIVVAGVDLGVGMPKPVDHRDLPYIWQESFFSMDENLLRNRLKDSELHIGNIKDVGRRVLNCQEPVGFISFDLDYYSSTIAAFESLLYAESQFYLPRVVCYFDDTIGPHHEMHSSFTGELLAIEEFNRTNAHRKLGKLNGLRYKVLPNDGPWVEGIYVLHLFDHPQYNQYIYPNSNRQFPLK